jgi:hypothetical protein
MFRKLWPWRCSKLHHITEHVTLTIQNSQSILFIGLWPTRTGSLTTCLVSRTYSLNLLDVIVCCNFLSYEFSPRVSNLHGNLYPRWSSFPETSSPSLKVSRGLSRNIENKLQHEVYRGPNIKPSVSKRCQISPSMIPHCLSRMSCRFWNYWDLTQDLTFETTPKSITLYSDPFWSHHHKTQLSLPPKAVIAAQAVSI